MIDRRQADRQTIIDRRARPNWVVLRAVEQYTTRQIRRQQFEKIMEEKQCATS